LGKGGAFVPTMGALHEGHLSLVRRARRAHKRVAVSIFVNPTQFGPNEDFSRYPRQLAADRRLLAAVPGVLLYAPSADEVYPKGFASTVRVGGSLASELEGRFRPGHFDGVATVVARLFALLGARHAYFGLKDYQQFQVIRRMTADLGLAVKLTGCPTVRERDGLALSSRNRYLNPLERGRATALIRALRAARGLARRGERSAARIQGAGLRVLRAVPGLKVQYFSLADAHSLAPLKRLDRPAVLATACVLGRTRLIDNLLLRP
jgi:pantoate--beta-alanine ligase